MTREYQYERLIRQLIQDALGETWGISDVAFAGTENGTFHISFVFSGDLTFEKVDKLSSVFKTKKINFLGHHESSYGGGCSTCGGGDSETAIGVNVYEAQIDLPPPPPPKPPKPPAPPRYARYFCQQHLDQAYSLGIEGGHTTYSGSLGCTAKGCRKKARVEFYEDERVG
jgi:hypothetical protein